MTLQWRKWLVVLVLVLAAGAAAAWALRPQPVPVDTVQIARGVLEVVVSEEGRTRVRDVYTVSTPVAGTIERTPRQVGDAVTGGQTVVAILRPSEPGFLDARARREAEALVAAVESMVAAGQAQVREAEAQFAYANSEHARASRLRPANAISESRFEELRAAARAAEARLAGAQATLAAYRQGLAMARARLVGPAANYTDGDACCLPLHAPVDGRVLTVHHENEQVLAAGTVLVDIGDPQRLEVVAEVLSSDAVRVPPGASARIDGWGGPKPLAARVRRVEPAGFTKISALGIEEQRVRVILDFDGPPEERQGLGHGYRIMAHIAVKRIEDAPLVPIGALFRRGENWAVYVADAEDRAHERVLEIGERTGREAMVLSGLEAGDRVVLHPSDRVSDGARIRERDGR